MENNTDPLDGSDDLIESSKGSYYGGCATVSPAPGTGLAVGLFGLLALFGLRRRED